MNQALTPLQLIIATVAGWLNRQQADIVDYLAEQVQVLLEIQGTEKLRLADDQRRRLAVKAKAVGRKKLFEIPTIFTPDTILGWHRKLVALKYVPRNRGPGRPPTIQQIRELIVRFASDNPTWGYTRIMGALDNVGHTVSRSTVANVLREHGLTPAPERGKRTRWRDFLRAHWDQLAATDFFTVEAWTKSGLTTFYVLFIIELATRRIEIAGITTNPNAQFMAQVAREITDEETGFLRDKRFLIHDRDTKFTEKFAAVLDEADVACIKLPRRSPNLNAYAERFVRSIKHECLNRMILFGQRALHRTLREYVDYYHTSRNHQGLDNELIDGERTPVGEIQCEERLGGLLKHYRRVA